MRRPSGADLCSRSIRFAKPNVIYQEVMERALAAAQARGVRSVAFGDRFLEDITVEREGFMYTDLLSAHPQAADEAAP